MPAQPTARAGPMLAPRPPLVAYREDLARRGRRGSFGPSDATWLSVATILSHAVDLAPGVGPALVPALREVLRGDPWLRALVSALGEDAGDEAGLDAVSPIVRALVEQMEDEGALSLAYSTLATLAEADVGLGALERGRLVAQMGRVAWKAGALDTSREHYHRTEVLGRAVRSPELRARAWVGYSVIALLRGNYPEVRKWATRAAHEADRAGLQAVGSLAYHGLMVSAGVAGDLNAALVYGWRAFEGAGGDPAREAEMLLNLSQVLYEAGHADAAVHGFAATLAREPVARVALPAVGGLALAAAALGDADRVRAAHAQAERLLAMAALPYASAGTLVELSEALGAIGDAAGAAEFRARALGIAASHGYHELTHRLDSLPAPRRGPAPDERQVLDPNAAAVARAVTSLGLVTDGASQR